MRLSLVSEISRSEPGILDIASFSVPTGWISRSVASSSFIRDDLFKTGILDSGRGVGKQRILKIRFALVKMHSLIHNIAMECLLHSCNSEVA